MGLTLKEVSETTKIRVKYLAALEDDDYGVIPGPTFIKAYLRTYASILRLDADDLVDEYRSTYERRQSSTSEYYDLTLEQMRNRSVRGSKKRPVRNTRRGYTLIGVLAIVAVVLLAFLGSRGEGGEPVVGPDSIGGTTTTLSGEVTTTTLGVAGSTTTSEAVYTGSEVSLRIVATGDCALVIRRLDRDGETVFQGRLESGQETMAEGSKRYWVSIGNPDAVQIYINGITYQSPDDAGAFYVTETKIESVQ